MTLLPENTKGLILDMDGVLWADPEPIGDLPAVFARFKDLGLSVAMATNNSTNSVDQFVGRLKSFGVEVDPAQVVTSSLAVADLMLKKLPVGAPIFAIGERGLMEALAAAQFEVLPVEDAEQAEAVVMGLDRQINAAKMREANLLVRAGKPFFATNPDRTFPTPRGQVPGAGAWISVIVTASDIQPIYAGKPYPYMMELALKRIGTSRENTLVVGDRLETDIAGGQVIGCRTALVLSGVSNRAQGEAWQPRIDIIVDNLSTLIGLSKE